MVYTPDPGSPDSGPHVRYRSVSQKKYVTTTAGQLSAVLRSRRILFCQACTGSRHGKSSLSGRTSRHRMNFAKQKWDESKQSLASIPTEPSDLPRSSSLQQLEALPSPQEEIEEIAELPSLLAIELRRLGESADDDLISRPRDKMLPRACCQACT